MAVVVVLAPGTTLGDVPAPATPDPVQRDLYAILGVSPLATPDEIRHAWREVPRRLHPDTAAEGDSDINHAGFVEATGAYEILADPTVRRGYDADHLYLYLFRSEQSRHVDSSYNPHGSASPGAGTPPSPRQG